MTAYLKVSAADLGTNTLKVTHATRLDGGDLNDMQHASDTVRLGFNLGKTRGSSHNESKHACVPKEKQSPGVWFDRLVSPPALRCRKWCGTDGPHPPETGWYRNHHR